MSKKNRKGRVDVSGDPRFPPKNPAEDLTLAGPHYEELDIFEGQERMSEDEHAGENRPTTSESKRVPEKAEAIDPLDVPPRAPKDEL